MPLDLDTDIKGRDSGLEGGGGMLRAASDKQDSHGVA